ncbi:ATP-binding protein [Thiomicrorhabdus sp. Kp2]|uniref:hybrid sensor histidine kinase/response regulator n=1 Tax=Thiomicrorhabdus sp. Kp2 TaxID=1123518 RepID=UPI000414B4AA|nr:ATP-binding protein [Thiomicrorhabdus sp. Kp2]
MSIPQTILANEMFHKNLWWTYAKEGDKEVLNLSEAFKAYLGRQVVTIEEMMGEYETQLLRLKIEGALASKRTQSSDFDMRFVASYQTVKGKRTLQHQLRVLELNGVKMVWASCIDVSEMAALEREMVDAQGRLSLQQVVEREQHIEEQNRFVHDSYIKQSRFLAMLSHELRSPLLGISSLVKRLRNEVDASPETLNMLKTIHMTAEQSTYLVNDILTYSQTEYDGITLHPTEVSLTELLENVKQLTKSIGSDKNLVISLVYLGKHEYVLADGVRLTQILINLIVNGIKFTQYGGVNIEVNEKEDGVFVFKITDSGEGIPENRLQRIFEPFAQLEASDGEYTSNTTYLGAGLGLFVVKQLVELMQGSIQVKSSVGVGTSFEFCLQLPCILKSHSPSIASAKLKKGELIKTSSVYYSENLLEKEDEETALSPLEQHYKVLIADDSKINRMVLAGYLAELDCEVFEAKDGREAWALFQQESFDYVLLDIQMPFMDGLQVSQNIQQLYEKGQTPTLKGVFAITAGGDSSGFVGENENHEGLGFDKWLVKPVGKNQIISLLDKNYRQSTQEKTPFSEKETAWKNVSEQDDSLQRSQQVNDELTLHTLHDIPEQFHHLFDSFMKETISGFEKLCRYNLQNEAEEIKKLAHYLKGNCMLFQLTGLVTLFKELETIQEKALCQELNKQQRLKKTEKTLQKIVLIVKSLEKSDSISHNNG